jgi:hypothetical protein
VCNHALSNWASTKRTAAQCKPIVAIGALLHPQLRSPQVASDQKSAPAMPITLIVATDNFLTRHHVFLRKNVLMR